MRGNKVTILAALALSASPASAVAQGQESEDPAQAAAQRIAEHSMAALPRCLKMGASAWNSKLNDAGPHQYGLVVNVIQPSCSAEEAGLQVGDMIVRWRGQAFSQAANLPRLVSEDSQPVLELQYIRPGEGLRNASLTYAGGRAVRDTPQRQAMLLTKAQLAAQCDIMFGALTERQTFNTASVASFADYGPAGSASFWYYDGEVKYRQARQAWHAGQHDKGSELMFAASNSFGTAAAHGKQGALVRSGEVLGEREQWQLAEEQKQSCLKAKTVMADLSLAARKAMKEEYQDLYVQCRDESGILIL